MKSLKTSNQCFFKLLAIAFGLSLFSASSQAAMLTVSGDISIFNNPGGYGEFDLSDTFSFQFNLDDSDVDTQPSTTSGSFVNSISSLTFTKTGGTGSWDPVGGVFTTPLTTTGTSSAVNHTVVFQLTGVSGFPTAGGNAFTNMALTFTRPAGTSPINDIGAGQSLFNQIGGTFNPSDFPVSSATFSFSGGLPVLGNISNVSVSAVPVPAAVWLMASALIGLMGFRKKKV